MDVEEHLEGIWPIQQNQSRFPRRSGDELRCDEGASIIWVMPCEGRRLEWEQASKKVHSMMAEEPG